MSTPKAKLRAKGYETEPTVPPKGSCEVFSGSQPSSVFVISNKSVPVKFKRNFSILSFFVNVFGSVYPSVIFFNRM